MNNFTFYTPTKIYFGDGMISNLHKISDYGKSVLIVYGKSSIKKNGIYDKVVEELKLANMDIFELSGVDPNPRIDSVRESWLSVEAQVLTV